MNVDIGTEAAKFPEKEFINRVFVAVQGTHRPRDASSKGLIVQGTHRPRGSSSKGLIFQGTHRPRDTLSKGQKIRDILFGDTSVGD
jgi:hypothetical protein